MVAPLGQREGGHDLGGLLLLLGPLLLVLVLLLIRERHGLGFRFKGELSNNVGVFGDGGDLDRYAVCQADLGRRESLVGGQPHQGRTLSQGQP